MKLAEKPRMDQYCQTHGHFKPCQECAKTVLWEDGELVFKINAYRRITELEQEVFELRQALEKYGRHKEDCYVVRDDSRRLCPQCAGRISRHPTYDTEPEHDVYCCNNVGCIANELAWSIKFKKRECTCGLEQALERKE